LPIRDVSLCPGYAKAARFIYPSKNCAKYEKPKIRHLFAKIPYIIFNYFHIFTVFVHKSANAEGQAIFIHGTLRFVACFSCIAQHYAQQQNASYGKKQRAMPLLGDVFAIICIFCLFFD